MIPRSSSAASRPTAAFLEAYADHSGRPLPEKRLHWRCRLHVLRDGYYVYRQGMAGFEEELEALLDRGAGLRFHA